MKFYGELLIFVLLFVINLRVFFVNSVKRDPIVAFAPLTFILSIIQIFSWGVDVFTILGIILSFLVLLSNFHALFRYTERLYVDHYSVLMKVWAIFTDILSLGAITCLIIFAPMELKNRSANVIETKSKYSGNFTTGFESLKAFDKLSAILYEYEKAPEPINPHEENHSENNSLSDVKSETAENVEKEQQSQAESNNAIEDVEKSTENTTKNIVLFVPDKRGDTYNYRPYLQLLASTSRDFIVLSGDFYANDCKWFHSFADLKVNRNFAMVINSIKDQRKFSASRELYTYNISRECQQLLTMINEKYGKDCKIFLISDGMSNDGVSDFAKHHPDIVTGHFKLDSVPEYKSSGYGFIAETNPLLNAYLGLPRERKFETPKLLVEKTKELIKF